MILMGSIKMNLCPFIITSYNVIGENVEKPVWKRRFLDIFMNLTHYLTHKAYETFFYRTENNYHPLLPYQNQ